MSGGLYSRTHPAGGDPGPRSLYSGKAASLAANEHVPTPKAARPDVNPRTNAKAAGPPKPLRPAAQPKPLQTESATKAQPRYHGFSTTPFFPGQKPSGFHSPGRGGALIPVYTLGHGHPGPEGNLQTLLGGAAKGQTLRQSQTALTQTYRQNHPVGQQIIEGVAATVPGVSLAKAVRDHKIGGGALASEAFNDLTSGLLPAGKVAGVLGGIKGLRDVTEAAKVEGKLTKAQQKALQVVREGTPISDRIAEHQTQVAGDIKPYVAARNTGEDLVNHEFTGDAYSYHRTTAEAFPAVRKRGLRSLTPNEDTRGVYFGQDPLQARDLSWKSRAGSVFVRVQRSALRDVQERAFGEHFTPHDVPPKDLEYLGADKRWHPLTDRNPGSRKELAALKAAQKYVHDVNGMPRIRPEHPDLVAAFEKAAAQTPNEQLRGTLKGARAVRGKQEAGYSAERSARVANASEHLNDTSLAPAERIALAKGELKGELPKIDFQGMKVLDENALKALQTHILDHPHLMPFQKIRAAEALTNAVAGKVPTNSELTLLEHVFGKETADGLGSVASHPLRDLILSTLNVPRSLMASFDLSAPFRQGLVTATRHPAIFAKNFGPMVKAFGSERVYQGLIADIHSRPSYPMMMEAKLAITDLGKEVGPREERFASDVAEHIPVIGRGIRASGRAYTGFLDKMRADVFDHLIQTAKTQGIDVQDEKFLKSLGTYINSATGRGNLGHFQEAGKVLNTFFFSPKLLASRLNFMNPFYYARLDPFARKEALRAAIQLSGTLSTLLGLASQIPGVTVVSDPRNPDWGKIKHGHTRIDIAGGFQQPLRLFAQLATGTAISSTTGKKLNLTANGFGQPTRLDLFLRFFEGKESPWASFATDFLRNSNQVGTKFSWSKEAYQRVIPLLAQDSYSLYQDQHGGMNGLAAAFAGYGVGSVGFGLQTYGPKKAKAKAPRGPGSTGLYGSPTSSSSAGTGLYSQSP